MNLETLIELLKNFHDELKICMENKHGGIPGAHPMSDPILLGDFIVDTYNSYLAAAKSTCENPLIQRMSEVEKLGESSPTEYDIKKGVGNHPRLHKMREVALATKQLATLLMGQVQMDEAESRNEIAEIMALMENLEIQLDRFILVDNPEENRQSLQHLVEAYNSYLSMVLEATDDPVLTKMFRPVEIEGNARAKLTELRLAQSGLLSYLRKKN